MLKKIAYYCGCFVFSASLQAATLSLSDGSTITGEIDGLNEGVYTINSPTLGLLKIPQASITNIQYGEVTTQNNESNATAIGEIQNQINNTPSLLEEVQSLKQESDIQAVLNDDKLLDAVKSGDFGALLSDPKIQNMMNNVKVQAISEQLQKLK